MVAGWPLGKTVTEISQDLRNVVLPAAEPADDNHPSPAHLGFDCGVCRNPHVQPPDLHGTSTPSNSFIAAVASSTRATLQGCRQPRLIQMLKVIASVPDPAQASYSSFLSLALLRQLSATDSSCLAAGPRFSISSHAGRAGSPAPE